MGSNRASASIERDFAFLAGGGNVFRVVTTANAADAETLCAWMMKRAIAFDLVPASARVRSSSSFAGRSGQRVCMYADIISSMRASSSQPRGHGTTDMLQQLIRDVQEERSDNGESFEKLLSDRLRPMWGMTGGTYFVDAVKTYCMAHLAGDEETSGAALAWLEDAAQPTRTIARRLCLGPKLRDVDFFARLKHLSRLAQLSNRGGLFVIFNEVHVLLSFRPSVRASHYDEMNAMLGQLLQEEANPLGVYFVGNRELHRNRERGLKSNRQLYSRISPAFTFAPEYETCTRPLLDLPALNH